MAKRKASTVFGKSKRMRRTRRPKLRRRGGWNSMVSRRGPIARKAVVRMRYCEQISLDAGIGNFNSHFFSCNNIFDPNVTGTGHQPLGHDQWSNFYNHYRVIGSKITAEFSQTGTTSNDTVVCGVLVNDDTANAGISIVDLVEQGDSNYRILPALIDSKAKIVKKFSAKKFLGDRAKHQSSQASFGSSPSEQAYFQVYVGALAVGGNPGIQNVLVTIEYIVVLSEPKDLAQS